MYHGIHTENEQFYLEAQKALHICPSLQHCHAKSFPKKYVIYSKYVKYVKYTMNSRFPLLVKGGCQTLWILFLK
jgi:hypothetical protein